MIGKKRRKSTRFRGSHSHKRGFKKKGRGSGHRGGFGMAGTGKRADQKKTLVLNLYGNDYFGKDKTLRRGTVKNKLLAINLGDIASNMHSLIKSGKAKEEKGNYALDLKEYKILGSGELKIKAKIHASAASKSAIEKVKKSGGEIILSEIKKEEKTKGK